MIPSAGARAGLAHKEPIAMIHWPQAQAKRRVGARGSTGGTDTHVSGARNPLLAASRIRDAATSRFPDPEA
jgi:hypothetical protein